jgi:hypothetical protein
VPAAWMFNASIDSAAKTGLWYSIFIFSYTLLVVFPRTNSRAGIFTMKKFMG